MIAKDHVMQLVRAAGLSAVILAAAVNGHAQDITGTGTVIAAAPVFLTPDASRVPLATLPVGATVKVVSKENAWYRVVFHDSQWGDRNGFMLAANLRVEAAPPDATPPPGAMPQATGRAQAPATGSATPRGMAPHAARGFVSVNGAYEGTSTGFSSTTTFVKNAEVGTVSTSYGGGHPPVIDIGGSGRIWHALGLSVAGTWSIEKTDSAVSAQVPHPFMFNAPRRVEGVAPGLKRREIAFHLDPAVLLPIGDRLQLAVFAGPSYFRARQGLVTEVTVTDVYPYDTATFASATSTDATKSHLGYNAGVDLAVDISRTVGVGLLARYSRATLTFDAPEGGTAVESRAGGLQVGGGLRVRF
jgi:hypothetical protein